MPKKLILKKGKRKERKEASKQKKFPNNANNSNKSERKEEFSTNVTKLIFIDKPELLERENERSIEKQKERRKNLLILERLAINVMNKSTKNAVI